MLMKGQKELKDMTSDKTYETLVLVKYFKLTQCSDDTLNNI